MEDTVTELTLDDLRLLKQAVTLATDELSRRKVPHREMVNQLDLLYQKLRNLGA